MKGRCEVCGERVVDKPRMDCNVVRAGRVVKTFSLCHPCFPEYPRLVKEAMS